MVQDLSSSLRDAPLIPGLMFRAYRGPEDFPGMVAVYDACRPVDRYEWPVTVDDLARTLSALKNSDEMIEKLNGEATAISIIGSLVQGDIPGSTCAADSPE